MKVCRARPLGGQEGLPAMYTHDPISPAPVILSLLAAIACGHTEPASTVSEREAQSAGGVGTSTTASDDEWAQSYSPATCDKAATLQARTSLTCEPTIGARTFTRALCSCEDTNVTGLLHTRSFRSGTGTTAERLGGSVGVNHDY